MDTKRKKRLLHLLNQSNAANIPYDGENGELVQLITEFFIDDEPTSDDEEEEVIGGAEEHRTSDGGDELEDTTPLVTVCRTQRSVENQSNGDSCFPTASAAASFACRCTQIKTAEGTELPVEQRRGCISQFSHEDVAEFQLNILEMEKGWFRYIY